MDEFESTSGNDVILKTPIGRLIVKLNVISKKPSIESELGETLDIFLSKLKEADRYLENGICFTNFAEAALLLQTSAELYAKKVDLLWDFIIDYQSRIISYEKTKDKDLELAKLEERKRRCRKRTKDVETVSSSNMDTIFADCYKPIFMDDISCEPDNDLIRLWEKFGGKHEEPHKTPSFEINFAIRNQFLEDFPILDEEEEEQNTTYSRVLGNNLFPQLFYYNDNNVLPDEDKILNEMRLEYYIIHNFLRENDIPLGTPHEIYEKNLNLYADRHFKKQNLRKQQLTNADQLLDRTEAVVRLERVPEDGNDKLRRISVRDGIVENNIVVKTSPVDCIYELECTTEEVIESPCELSVCLENSHTEIATDKDTGVCVFNNEAVEENDDGLDTCYDNVSDDNEGDNTGVFMEENTTTDNTEMVIEEKRLNQRLYRNAKEKLATVQMEILNNMLMNMTRERSKLKRSIDATKDDLEHELPYKRRRLTPKEIKNLSIPILTVKLKQWECFYVKNYHPQENEGKLSELDCGSTDTETVDVEDLLSDDEFQIIDVPAATVETTNDITNVPNTEVQDKERQNESTTNSELSDSGIFCTFTETTIEDISVEPTVADYHTQELDTSNGANIEASQTEQIIYDVPASTSYTSERRPEQICRENVDKWKSSITPILKKLDGSEFDIHQYGSDIIEPMEINETKLFKNIVEGKSSAHVVRYFISTLQLANTGNVELSGAKPGELSNDTLTLKLLNKERYHEHLQEYQAPSEETFRQRLAQMQKRNPHLQLHSTPIREPPLKKIKVVRCTKLF